MEILETWGMFVFEGTSSSREDLNDCQTSKKVLLHVEFNDKPLNISSNLPGDEDCREHPPWQTDGSVLSHVSQTDGGLSQEDLDQAYWSPSWRS